MWQTASRKILQWLFGVKKMKRVEESAMSAPERAPYEGQDCENGHSADEPVAKCDWGKPLRTGAKPTWYQNLFH